MRMTTLLLLIIFICYIGLGVPDSLLGAAWPAIYTDFGLPVSAVNLVTVLISGGTILSSLFSARLVNRFGTGKITAVSTTMTAVALLGFSCSGSLPWLCLSAIPLGLGAGSIDVALNNYVALHYSATHMSLLHCFYGIGVSLSPYLMSLALSDQNNWRQGYRTVFYLQSAIAVLTLLALPLWKRVRQKDETQAQEPARTLSLSALFRMPAVRASWGILIGSCGIESVCLVWGSTFLADAKQAPPYLAAKIITLYFAGLALGRLLSGLAAARVKSWTIIRTGQAVTLAAILLLFLPLAPLSAGFSLFLVGLGNGPLFPNMTHLTPISFGRDISQSVIGTQMAFSYASILLSPVLFGQLARHISIGLFAPFLLVLFALMLYMTWQMRRRLGI